MVSKDFQLGAGHSLIKRIQNYENKVKYKVSIYLDWGGLWQFADALQIQVCVLRDLFRQVTRKAHTERLPGRHLPSLPCLQHPQEAPVCSFAGSAPLGRLQSQHFDNRERCGLMDVTQSRRS